MAFDYSQVEPVNFGDFTSRPIITAEARLRLSNLELKLDNLEAAAEILARCFGEDTPKVEEFLKRNAMLGEYARLQVYLLQGENGVKKFEKLQHELMTEQVDKALEEANSKGKDNA